MATVELVKSLGSNAARPDIPDDSGEVAEFTIRKLKIVTALTQAGVDVQIADVITAASAVDTISGAPQLTISILDRDYRLLTSGAFGATVDVVIDSIPYRLVEVSLTDTEALDLKFEHLIVALLRKHTGPLKAARGTVTRAGFIETMLREIADEFPGLRYVCPEINTPQPVTSSKKSGRSLTSKTVTGKQVTGGVRGSGFGVSSLRIRNWDGAMVTLGPAQLQNAATVLQTCDQAAAPAKAVLACAEACIVEAPLFANSGVATDHTSTGILQLLSTTAAGLGISALDIVACVTAFLTRGFTGAGGAIALAKQNPSWSAGQIAQAVQGSAFPARYDAAQQGAAAVISAWTQSTGSTFTGFGAGLTLQQSATTGKYEFTRGQSGQAEDSWTCMLRLASEVNWRCFIAGARTVYFVTDDDLIKGDTKYLLQPGSKGITRPSFITEVGKRTIVVKGRRQPKPSEAQFDVRVDRWQAPIGSVVELDGWGPADDKWILIETDSNLFDAAATIRIHAPQKDLPEPAAATTTTTQSVAGPFAASPGLNAADPIDRVYAAAQIIDKRNLPYIFGGGHTGSWASAMAASGLDCSSSTSLALHMAGLMDRFPAPIVSGDFSGWGVPGRGREMTVWYTGGHVFIEFYGRPAQRFDTVPGGSGGDGPHLRFTARGNPQDLYEASGFAARSWPGF